MRAIGSRRASRTPFVFAGAFALSLATVSTALAAPGDLDTSFGGNGIAVADVSRYIDWGHAMVLQPDGKIVVAGGAGRGSVQHEIRRRSLRR